MANARPGKATAEGRPAAPSSGGNRRDKLASFEAARKRDQRVRTVRLLVICGVLALALLAYPVYLFANDYRARNATLADLGAPLASAGCDPVASNPATGNQQHVAEGTKVSYGQTPPDSGAHYPTPAPFTKRFYTPADRPAVELLVHNLEHGYTVAWYRDDMPADEIATLKRVSQTFSSSDYNPADKFIAAPWSASDGAALPEGKNVVLAHWTTDPTNPADTSKQIGVRQFCGSVSGPAVAAFMASYPATSSPEPNGI